MTCRRPSAEKTPVHSVIWTLTAHRTAARGARLVFGDLRTMLPTIIANLGCSASRLIAPGAPNSYESMAAQSQPTTGGCLPKYDDTTREGDPAPWVALR